MVDNIADASQDVLAVDLKTAARMLGLTEGAVRKQLALGKREGMKNERGQWVEVLVRPEEVVPVEEPVADSAGGHDIALLRELLAEKDRRLAASSEEIDFLRQRVQNLEMLLGQSLQNQKALLPPEPVKPEGRRGFWPWGARKS
jgi:hypothetical protein